MRSRKSRGNLGVDRRPRKDSRMGCAFDVFLPGRADCARALQVLYYLCGHMQFCYNELMHKGRPKRWTSNR